MYSHKGKTQKFDIYVFDYVLPLPLLRVQKRGEPKFTPGKWQITLMIMLHDGFRSR
jgi:hypothetical protein